MSILSDRKGIGHNDRKGKVKIFISILSLLIFIGIGSILSPSGFCAANQKFDYAEETKAVYEIRELLPFEYSQPDLSRAVTRDEGVLYLVKYFGLDYQAFHLTEAEADSILQDFEDCKTLGLINKLAIAFAVKNKYVNGVSSKKFSPKTMIDGRAFCTIALRMMGYNVNGSDYDIASAILSEKGGLTVRQAVKFNYKPLIRDDVFGILYSLFNAKTLEGKTLIQSFSEKDMISIDKAHSYGFDVD